MRHRVLAGMLAAALALGACGDDDGPEPSTTTSSTTTEAPTSTSTSTSTTAAPDTTEATTTSAAAAGPTCPGEGIPAAATAVVEEMADVDGDGEDDVLRSYLVGSTWSLQVELAAGGTAELELGAADAGGVGVIGGADVDGDGRAEVWARVGSGASTAILGMARLEGCALVRVVTGFGTPVELPVGGSVGAAGGVECRAAGVSSDLTVFSVVYVDDDHYEVTAVEHELAGTTLHPRGSTTRTVRFDDPELGRATTFTCHDLVL